MAQPHRRHLLIAAGALSAVGPIAAQAKTKSKTKRNDITTGWEFRQADSNDWLKASVPGTVHTDLLNNGKIEDPFYRVNERDQQWIDKKDWEYRTTLTLDAKTLAHDNVELHFAGLDTYADVYINDTKVLSADNMFREWTVDIKPHARPGANSLRIYFHSPIAKGLAALDAFGFAVPSPNDQGETGGLGDKKVGLFTRKAGYHYGWDWGPRFVTSGIWRPVTLRAWSRLRIEDVRIVQDSLTADAAQLTAVFEILASHDGPAMLDIASPTDKSVTAKIETVLKAGLNTVSVTFTIAKPRLWWSNGLGEAFLYSLKGRVTAAGVSDSREVRTGLRTIKVVQAPDADGTSFHVELNGVPVFMKGANYIPNDSFLPRVTHDVYDKVVQSAVDTHMNMLRVWGGGIYEDDYFYDLCDRNGILVWQDFMFACSMLPGDEAFLDNVRQEAVQNIRRLRNHACIALWCGNNEIDAAWQADVPNGGWGWKQPLTPDQRDRLTTAYNAIFHDILPAAVTGNDPQTFYWPSSPIAAWDGKNGIAHADHLAKQQSGDLHYWDVWWGQKPFSEYRVAVGRFMSEYGFQSFPEFKTVQAYTEPSDHDIFSEVMKAHQRSSIGNGTIKTYMERDYKVPADFRQFLYVGQVLQAEGIKVAMEAHRSRMPFCMGSLFWQINDCWPVASWSSIDYYGRWKAQQYFTRHAFAPILVAPRLDGETLTVTAISDRLTDTPVTVSLQVVDFHGKVIGEFNEAQTLRANTNLDLVTSTAATLLNGAAPETTLLHVCILDGDTVLSQNILYFKPVKDLTLPPVQLTTKVKAVGDELAVAVTSATLVKNLYLSLDEGDCQFEDNYFDLLPGETRVVRFKPAARMSAQQLEQHLRFMHMAQVQG
ncbi:glycosyl hydrolase family 2, sugar binding domain protein [Asticcacaulis biprosthecium C19]|uniref:Beta-mannosidase B n=1 Tax=Asticcacaulis biprosthecium C19 TaxID=715226 RepID=F4QML5_9CAUL|nr:glycoside hydrolase family 2 protein [Asticcacaulis biprosthecium]EGF91456.1 glycosyl hydrolase family 2, sugar binding domain protein [Asticcacaulis biprosthecium C19]